MIFLIILPLMKKRIHIVEILYFKSIYSYIYISKKFKLTYMQVLPKNLCHTFFFTQDEPIIFYFFHEIKRNSYFITRLYHNEGNSSDIVISRFHNCNCRFLVLFDTLNASLTFNLSIIISDYRH